MKLKHKTRHGAKVHKVYDVARTPYQRVLESGVLSTQKKVALVKLYQSLNPVQLLTRMNQTREQLWALAEYTDHTNRKEASVTPFMSQPITLR